MPAAKLRIDKNNILIFIIGALSLLNIVFQLRGDNYLSMANSAIGIAGVCLYLFGKDSFRYLIWAWIFAQAIVIGQTSVDRTAGLVHYTPIFDVTQIFRLNFGMRFSGSVNTISINFNVVVIAYVLLFRLLKTNSYLGKSVGLLFMKGDRDLQFENETFATIQRRVTLDSDDRWLLAQLNTPFYLDQIAYDRVLIYSHDGDLTDTIRIVPATETILETAMPLLHFQRAEWIVVE